MSTRAQQAGAAGAGPGSLANLPFSKAGAGAPAPGIGLGPHPWRVLPAWAPGTLPCEADRGWGPGHGRGTAPTAGPWTRAGRGAGGGAPRARGRGWRPGPGPPLLLPGSPQRRVQPGARGRFPLRREDRGRLLLGGLQGRTRRERRGAGPSLRREAGARGPGPGRPVRSTRDLPAPADRRFDIDSQGKSWC